MKPADIRAKMEQLNTFILDADTSVQNGKLVDLRGLDRDIAVICKQATSLPPPDARDLQPVMAELIGNLERLSFSLKDFKDGMKK
jgi:hypothetical protein